MLKSLTAALKLSELREKLNDLNAVAEPTEAQRPKSCLYWRLRKQPHRNIGRR